jgi:hypothetical protein
MPEPKCEPFVFTRDSDRLVGVMCLVGFYPRALSSPEPVTLMRRRLPQLLGPTTIEQSMVV